MNWPVFLLVLAGGFALIALQWVAAYLDCFLTKKDLLSRRVEGWSLTSHGGMWTGIFLISPTVAYLVSKYEFPYFSKWGLLILAAATIAWYALGLVYQEVGKYEPEAYTHYGETTFAGLINLLFAIIATWVLAMAYLGLTVPKVSHADLLGISTILTPFFYLGVKKFDRRWVFTAEAQMQVMISIAVIWIITLWKIFY